MFFESVDFDCCRLRCRLFAFPGFSLASCGLQIRHRRFKSDRSLSVKTPCEAMLHTGFCVFAVRGLQSNFEVPPGDCGLLTDSNSQEKVRHHLYGCQDSFFALPINLRG